LPVIRSYAVGFSRSPENSEPACCAYYKVMELNDQQIFVQSDDAAVNAPTNPILKHTSQYSEQRLAIPRMPSVVASPPQKASIIDTSIPRSSTAPPTDHARAGKMPLNTSYRSPIPSTLKPMLSRVSASGTIAKVIILYPDFVFTHGTVTTNVFAQIVPDPQSHTSIRWPFIHTTPTWNGLPLPHFMSGTNLTYHSQASSPFPGHRTA